MTTTTTTTSPSCSSDPLSTNVYLAGVHPVVEIDLDELCTISQLSLNELLNQQQLNDLPLVLASFYDSKKLIVCEAGPYLYYLQSQQLTPNKALQFTNPATRGTVDKINLLWNVQQNQLTIENVSQFSCFKTLSTPPNLADNTAKNTLDIALHYCYGTSLQLSAETRFKSLLFLFIDSVKQFSLTHPLLTQADTTTCKLQHATYWGLHLLALVQECYKQNAFSEKMQEELQEQLSSIKEINLSEIGLDFLKIALLTLRTTPQALLEHSSYFQELLEKFRHDEDSLSHLEKLKLALFEITQHTHTSGQPIPIQQIDAQQITTPPSPYLDRAYHILDSLLKENLQHAMLYSLIAQWSLASGKSPLAASQSLQTILHANKQHVNALTDWSKLYTDNPIELQSIKKKLITLLTHNIQTGKDPVHWRLLLVDTLLAEEPVSVTAVQHALAILAPLVTRENSTTSPPEVLLRLIELYFWAAHPSEESLHNGNILIQELLRRDPYHPEGLYHWSLYLILINPLDELYGSTEDETTYVLELYAVICNAITHHIALNSAPDKIGLLISTLMEVATIIEALNGNGFKNSSIFLEQISKISKLQNVTSYYSACIYATGSQLLTTDTTLYHTFLDKLSQNDQLHIKLYQNSPLLSHYSKALPRALFSPLAIAQGLLEELLQQNCQIESFEQLKSWQARYLDDTTEPPAHLSQEKKATIYSLLALSLLEPHNVDANAIIKATVYAQKALQHFPDSIDAHLVNLRLLLFPETAEYTPDWRQIIISIEKAKPHPEAYFFEMVAYMRLGQLSGAYFNFACDKLEQLSKLPYDPDTIAWLRQELDTMQDI